VLRTDSHLYNGQHICLLTYIMAMLGLTVIGNYWAIWALCSRFALYTPR
jgi:hypothetical protein